MYFKNSEGESKPTKKGITLHVKLFPELKHALLDAEKILTERGSL